MDVVKWQKLHPGKSNRIEGINTCGFSISFSQVSSIRQSILWGVWFRASTWQAGGREFHLRCCPYVDLKTCFGGHAKPQKIVRYPAYSQVCATPGDHN